MHNKVKKRCYRLNNYIIDIFDIILRSVLSVVFLFIITRIMGKKQISQLTYFDYVIGISIGSIAAEMATNTDIAYINTLLAMAIYAAIAVAISIVTNKSIKARRFFTGKTVLLIDNGKIIEKNLNKVRYDINDLLSEARNSGYFNISDIAYALLETNGKISFLPTIQKQPATLGDLGINKMQDGLTANVIIDGEVMENNLSMIGFNLEWLKKQLKEQDAPPIKEIILATVDSNNTLKVFEKTKKLIPETQID